MQLLLDMSTIKESDALRLKFANAVCKCITSAARRDNSLCIMLNIQL